jgi:hypothetical protein
VEEWKELLPESYARLVEDRQGDFVIDALGEMKRTLKRSSGPHQARHPEELKAWLDALDLAAEITFDLYRRGAKLGSFRAPGFLDYEGGIAFRARGAITTVVASLRPTGEPPGERAPIYLLRWNGER